MKQRLYLNQKKINLGIMEHQITPIYFQSRMNAPTTMNNVTLWDQQHVAPGLNLGYTTDGTGGFNLWIKWKRFTLT